METTEAAVSTIMFILMNMTDKKIKCNTTINRRIRSTFGCTADVIDVVWTKLAETQKLSKYMLK
jgi:hypothetical protein